MTGATNPTVLVCDDDPAAVDLIAAVIERHGYGVRRAHSAREALEVAAESQPDAVVIDMLMPGMSGWEAVAALKASPETEPIPVVVLSVLAPEFTRGEAPGATGWLQKPLEESALVGALEQAVEDPSVAFDRVLIVEDDLDLAPLLTALFERHGAEVLHAVTGEAAVALAEVAWPDLVILDLGLPTIDGYQVLEQLRRLDPMRRLPVVVYTAADAAEVDRERLGAGRTELVSKDAAGPAELERRVLDMLAAVTRDSDGAHPPGDPPQDGTAG